MWNANFQDKLYHHGIKGQRWGVRRYQNTDGSRTAAGKKRYNENYSSEQQTRDRRVYGQGGVRRINRHMNAGESISSARSIEAERINNRRRSGRILGETGSVAGTIGGAIGGYFASKKVMSMLNLPFDDPATNMVIQGAISAGSAALGKQLGRYGGQSIAMLSGGYSPSKYR